MVVVTILNDGVVVMVTILNDDSGGSDHIGWCGGGSDHIE